MKVVIISEKRRINVLTGEGDGDLQNKTYIVVKSISFSKNVSSFSTKLKWVVVY